MSSSTYFNEREEAWDYRCRASTHVRWSVEQCATSPRPTMFVLGRTITSDIEGSRGKRCSHILEEETPRPGLVLIVKNISGLVVRHGIVEKSTHQTACASPVDRQHLRRVTVRRRKGQQAHCLRNVQARQNAL